MKKIIGIIIFLISAIWSQGTKPNFLVFLVDDMGWMDLSVQGSQYYETPNIDKLAAAGVRFTDGYAAHPVCSPSRAALMSGKNPGRLQITQWIGGGGNGTAYVRELPLAEETIAEALKANGYATAFLGKWHLGETAQFWPENQGFDLNVGGHDRGQPPGGYFSPYNNPRMTDGPNNEYLTDRLADETITWMEANKDTSFFIYLSWYTIHTPLQAKQAKIDYFTNKRDTMYSNPRPANQTLPRGGAAKTRQDHPTLAAMISHLDDNVGRVLDKLEQLNLTNNTVVVFTTDNGGLSTALGNPGSNTPLKAGKGWLYEGGVRVPFILSWPAQLTGGTTTDQVAIGMDLYPTFLDAAGIGLKPQQHVDGKSLLPHLKGDSAFGRDVYFHYPHNHGGNTGVVPGSAIRFGDYKLVEWISDGSFELYDLSNDLEETNNIAAQNPEITQLLRWKLDNWRDTANVNMPSSWTPSVTNMPQIQGCIDPLATNFNLYATVDDGSCVLPVRGKNKLQEIIISTKGKQLLVTLPQLSIHFIIVYDINGNTKIKKQHHAEYSLTNLSGLQKGLYLITVNGKGFNKTIKYLID